MNKCIEEEEYSDNNEMTKNRSMKRINKSNIKSKVMKKRK